MSEQILICLNGEEHRVAPGSIGQLLDSLDLGGKKVAVELNRQIVPRSSYSDTHLTAGDELELVYFVGGG